MRIPPSYNLAQIRQQVSQNEINLMNFFADLWVSIPPLTRLMLCISVGLSLSVSLELVSPLKLYFNWPLIWNKRQYWRLVSSLFYKGELSAHTVFDFFIFYRYSSILEKQAFRNKPAHYIVFFVFGCLNFLLAAYGLGLQFMSNCISTMMLYIWARMNPNIPFNFLNVFNFRSCFLPYFMFMLILLSGYDPTMDLVGNLVGHLYFYLTMVVPKIPEMHQTNVLQPPKFLE